MSENQTDTTPEKNPSVLITGGSGLIGRRLTAVLLSKGCKVSHLSRTAGHSGNVTVFRWDPEHNLLDPGVFDGIDYIVHLAGANIGEKRWTTQRKKEILTSRIDSAKLIHKVIAGNHINIKAFITASAIGIYGSETSSRIYTESDRPSSDFLGSVCQQWEKASDLFADGGIRTVKIRSAVVLDRNDSALSKLLIPAKIGFLFRAGDGLQYMPWIHIDDMCEIYLKAIRDDRMEGPYNAVSPEHTTNRKFMSSLAHTLNRRLLTLSVPASVLKVILGEMSVIILNGSRVSSEKIRSTGYNFHFSNLEKAIENVINGQASSPSKSASL